MSRNKKLLCGSGLAAVVIIVALGWVLHSKFMGSPNAFDADFYKTADEGTFSYEPYAQTLAAYVDDKGMVHYAALKKDRAKLDRFVRMIAQVKPEQYNQWTEPAKIAFLTNAYNALTLKAIIDHYPIQAGLLKSLAFPKNSIRQIPGVWDRLQYLVMGRKMTLDEIEHKQLRAKFNEPRIHMALVCAAMGCPPLRNEPFLAEKLDAQFEDQSKRFFANPKKFRIDRDAGEVHLSKIFQWFGKDFLKTYAPTEGFDGQDETHRAVLNFSTRYLSAEDADYLRAGKYDVEFLDYDWSLNEQPQKDTPEREE